METTGSKPRDHADDTAVPPLASPSRSCWACPVRGASQSAVKTGVTLSGDGPSRGIAA